jgi:large repetitive protein
MAICFVAAATVFGVTLGNQSAGAVDPGAPTVFTGADNLPLPGTISLPANVAASFRVNAYSFPAATLTMTGSAPVGLSFADSGSSYGFLTGTPTVPGVYSVTFTAANTFPPAITQAVTITVTGTPDITSAFGSAMTVGESSPFTITGTGVPAPTISTATALPAGVTFTPNGGGTATLAGVPAPGTGGYHYLTFVASNGVGAAASQLFLLTISEAPSITSAAAASFGLSVSNSFTITTSGFPAAVLSETGALPAGTTLVSNGDGTATLAGTPTVLGSFPITIGADNGVGVAASQNFVLTVGNTPAFSSADSTTFTTGVPGSFVITTVGTPLPAISTASALPAGLALHDNGDGTATLSGTPTTAGVTVLNLVAANGVSPNATLSLTVTVEPAIVIGSADQATFTVGTAGTFVVTSSAGTVATIALTSGTLPGGLSLSDNGDGSATLQGTPSAHTGGSYSLGFTASNGVDPDATQAFTLTVNQAPAISSVNHFSLHSNSHGSFTVVASGYPIPSLTRLGGLPQGMSFVDNHNGTGRLSGTPVAAGAFVVTFVAANGVSPDASQTFTLTVTAALEAELPPPLPLTPIIEETPTPTPAPSPSASSDEAAAPPTSPDIPPGNSVSPVGIFIAFALGATVVGGTIAAISMWRPRPVPKLVGSSYDG